MQNQTQFLILAAEREAQMVSAIARMIMIATVAGIFVAIGGSGLPIWKFILPWFLFYAFVSVLSAAMAHPRFFRAWWAVVFTAVDGAALAILVGLVLRGVGLPPSHYGGVPGFIFFFSVLMLATMRYTIGPILAAFASFSLTAMVFLELIDTSAWIDGPALPADFIYGDIQNATRWLFVTTAVGLGLLAVMRRRAMLVAAISLGERTSNLSRYLPEPVARLVADQGLEALSRGRRQDAAVLFVDIRGFTSISERSTPESLGVLLSEFRLIVMGQVDDHSGIVDKFIGDAVMAVFGVPDPTPRDAENGLNCARAILAELARWNTERRTQGKVPINVSMGVHFGEVFAGAVGTARRMEFTVLGDTVSVASRLQESAKTAGSQLVVSEALLIAAGIDPTTEESWTLIAETAIRGRDGEVPRYADFKKS